MTVRSESSRSLPFLDSMRSQDREAVENGLARSDEQRLRAWQAHQRAVSELSLDFESRVRSLLGDRKRTLLRDAMARERIAFRELWQPPVTPGRDDRKANADRRARIDEVLKSLGGDAAALRAIGTDFARRSDELVTPGNARVVPGYAMSRHRDRWQKLSPQNRHPLPWGDIPEWEDPNDPHRWFTFSPPFFGFDFKFACSTFHYRADREHLVDPQAGLIGYRATLDSDNDKQYETGALGVLSAIAFGFEAPTAGLIEMLVDAQLGFGRHHVEMDDEWGWSHSTTTQQNFISMDVLDGNGLPGTDALMSDFRADFDGDDETVDREYLVRGQHYFAQAVSPSPVAGGRTAVIRIGTFGSDFSKRDDVGVSSFSHFSWFISSVQVRIAP